MYTDVGRFVLNFSNSSNIFFHLVQDFFSTRATIFFQLVQATFFSNSSNNFLQLVQEFFGLVEQHFSNSCNFFSNSSNIFFQLVQDFFSTRATIFFQLVQATFFQTRRANIILYSHIRYNTYIRIDHELAPWMRFRLHCI